MRSFCAVLVLCVFIMLVKTQSSTVSLSCRWSPGLHNYTDALSKTILFFEGQRSGKLPADQRIRWRRDSGLSDGASSTVDLVGVYYDAGDNVKFGYPMAFTTTMLSWTCLEFGRFMGAELSNAKAAIRWATGYLLKATAYPGTIFVQVGDPNNDHKCWERAEDMDTLRTAYKIDSHNPGSDVAAEIAAVLAAASLVFRGTDPSSSRKLIRASIMVFDFADKHRGSYSVSLKFAVCPFYCLSSGFEDELLWGAAWLYKATKNAKYLNYIRANGHSFGVHESDIIFGWFNKHAGPRVLLSKGFLVGKVKFLEDYKDHADDYICSIMPGTLASGSKYTPGGLLYTFPEVNMQYVTSASFLLMTYAKYLSSSKQVMSCGGMTVTPRRLREIAKGQVDYILGSNPLEMSYMVGYGSDYPQRIHHRGSSLPSLVLHPESIGCSEGFKFLNSDTPNPNILVGAVVGGPDANDQFPVDRHDYQHLRTYKIYQCSTAWSSPLFGPLYYWLLVLP